MHDGTHRLLPGQIRGFDLRRQTLLLALDGPLRLTYRDAALDWLPGGAPPVAILLDEGAAHRMPCAAWVDIGAGGGGGVTLGITSSSLTGPLRRVLAWVTRAVRWRHAGTRGARIQRKAANRPANPGGTRTASGGAPRRRREVE